MDYDVIVIGAGHAGCEAALAAARMGCRTLVLTMNLDSVATMPCNPSIGGPAKGHLVREIDALGGEMARVTDKTFIQVRVLNTGKGPAVQALRAQSDKLLYSQVMKQSLERQPGLDLKQGQVSEVGRIRDESQLSVIARSPKQWVMPPGGAPDDERPPSVIARSRQWGAEAGATWQSGGGATAAESRTTEPFSRQSRPGAEPVVGSRLLVRTAAGQTYTARSVVITTGTFLSGRLVTGETVTPGGRAGEPPSVGLSECLRSLGFRLGRLKTGTPPRVDVRSIDFSQTVPHPGHPTPVYFSFEHAGNRDEADAIARRLPPPNPAYPVDPATAPAWRPQLPCYLVHTNETTHQAVRANLHRAPMFNGTIQARGPRYCPSIEDKVHRFPDKTSHGLFLEPEGWETNEVYVQGANTSLPEDVQFEMLRSILALARCEMTRIGYAVEYDYVETGQTGASLESKLLPGLFFAGQINGTSGYEEAAAQGIMAGINAARRVQGRDPVLLRRDQAYIGVMLDDLVTRELTEPYRLLTSRAEYRLLLRQDNADLRLTPLGYELGLVSRARYREVENKRDAVEWELKRLGKTFGGFNNGAGSAAEWLRRPDSSYHQLVTLGAGDAGLPAEVVEQVEIECKYAGYIGKQAAEVERVRRVEDRRIPEDTDYDVVVSLSREGRDKLKRFRPATLGQASRVGGVTPADLSVLMVHLEKLRRGSESRC